MRFIAVLICLYLAAIGLVLGKIVLRTTGPEKPPGAECDYGACACHL